MTVTIKKKDLTLTSLVKRLFPTDQTGVIHQANILHANGFVLKLGPAVIGIVDSAKYVVCSASVKMETLNLALADKLGYASKSMIKTKIENLINHGYAHHCDAEAKATTTDTVKVYEGDAEEFKAQVMAECFPKPGITKQMITAIKKLRELTHWSLKDAKHKVDDWVDDWMKVDPIKGGNPTYANGPIMDLEEAKQLHQKVHGTSISSSYYVVAIGEGVKVAVRIKSDNSVGIRAVCISSYASVEGKKIIEGFKRAGLDKATGDHWSVHLSPPNLVMAERSIGSTLFAMGLVFDSISGNLKALVGK